jgi:hypothetical protein
MELSFPRIWLVTDLSCVSLYMDVTSSSISCDGSHKLHQLWWRYICLKFIYGKKCRICKLYSNRHIYSFVLISFAF